MSQVIAGIYEIEREIGSGGGGIVYLGRHMRLEKQVVLKADKRTLSTGTEVLRREVDMLKGLSHTYIPQVYDFVQENGVVYTVMDFIEGESLDKLLGRGMLPDQPRIIRWACELLEALAYLHSRPPHGILHGDIKPANIMLRPDGDVCLIDFNIALALGEDGAVKVGFSRGYASPEHYGADYISSSRPAAVGNPDHSRVTEDSEKTVVAGEITSSKSVTGGQKGILLDVRSDIYSLGATLYHLLSGHRPAQDALKVKPLGREVCSPCVSAVIQKAMAPQPEMRYQSAEEMLTAFRQLYQRDSRVIRHKRSIRIATAVLTASFLLGGGCTFVGLKQLEQRQTALTLAEYSANALTKGEVSEAVRLALEAIPRETGILDAQVTPQAQKALTDALGVYDLSAGFRDLDTLSLPGAPFGITSSPGGTRFAVRYAYETAVYDMEEQQTLALLPMLPSALADCVFVDDTYIIYSGSEGVTAYDLDAQKTLWTGSAATGLTVSGDGRIAAAVNRDEDHAVIYRVSDGTKIGECSFGGRQMSVAANDIFADPGDQIFTFNEDGSRLAVSFSDGGLSIFNPEVSGEELIIYEESDYRHFEGGFYDKYFAYTAQKSGDSQFGLIDMEEEAFAGGYESQNALMLQTDECGIYLAEGNLLVGMKRDSQDTGFLKEEELAYTESENMTAFSVGEDYVLAVTQDQGIAFYDRGAKLLSKEISSGSMDFAILSEGFAVVGNRNEPSLRLMKLEDHREAEVFTYDARYEHDEARISQDGRTVMLFGVGGFCIYDREGRLLSQVELPDAGNIYDQQFKRGEGESWLEVIWYDGTLRCYSGADGALVSEEMGTEPSKDLFEEFYTTKYRITSPLHSAPQVYDLESGRLVAELEKDDYLTYVTQTGDYLITEYIRTTGERYGLLLDGKLQKLAYLPGLCDVSEDMLVFDYGSGNLRQCRLYSLQELVALGETYLAQ